MYSHLENVKSNKSNGGGAPATNGDSSPVTNGDSSPTTSPVTSPVTDGDFSPVTTAGSSTPVITTGSRAIDPHSLVHKSKLPKPIRAVLGAEVLDGRVPMMNPTREVVAKVVGVSVAYLDKARRLSPEQRQAVARGKRPLVER